LGWVAVVLGAVAYQPIVHASLLVFLSLLLISAPKEDLLWLTGGDSDSAQLEDMELEELQFDDISVPGVDGPASLGPIAEGDEINLPGPETGVIGNVFTGPTNAGSVGVGTGSGGAPSMDRCRRGDIARAWAGVFHRILRR
jgi:hypothetical protein